MIAEGQDTLASFGRISSPTKLCFALQVQPFWGTEQTKSMHYIN